MRNTSLYLILILFGCNETNTTDPDIAFQKWLGISIPEKHVNVFHAQYWESANWSKEYEVFFEIETSKTWWEEFVKMNDLIISSSNIILPNKKPKWFVISDQSKHWTRRNDFSESIFIYDPEKNHFFIYEIQL